MNHSGKQLPSTAVIVLTAIAAGLCSIVGGIASGTVLSLVPAGLLVRYVVADYEGTMVVALLSMAGLAMVSLSSSELACLVAIGAAFTAAELAALAARLQRNDSDGELRRRLLDVGRNIAFGLGALVIGGLATLAHPPTRVAIAALVVATLGVLTWLAITVLRTTDEQPESPR